ncbi:hypothetical protein COY32_00475, partial [candidate division WWE3 bacterium CG_4_10_14_0_2_um_filter_41_14]
VYFYDTTLDTDYGTGKSTDPLVWRFNSSKSWYSETIDATYAACNPATHDRCGTKYFPEKSHIVATVGNLYVFDAEENKMWMKFDTAGTWPNLTLLYGSHDGVYMLNGVLYVGNKAGNALHEVRFITDSALMYGATGKWQRTTDTVAQRNTVLTWNFIPASIAIVNSSVNDVHAAVINGKTYVAVATADGWSLINETDGTVASDTSGYSVRSIFISKDGELYTLLDSGGPHFKLYAYYNAQNLGPGTISYGLWNYTYSNTTAPYIPTSGYELINLNVTEGTSTIDGTSNTIYVGTTSNGAIVLQEKQTDETNGSVKYVTSDYISEEMVGDIRGMWPMYEGSVGATVDEVSVKNADLTVVSTPTVADGVRGNALDFDGSTDYLAQTPVEEYDESHTDVDVGIWYDTSSKRHAQGIQVPSTTSVGTVRLWMKKVGSPTNYLRVELQTDSSGTPSNTPVTNGTSTCIAQSTLSTSSSWVGFKFATAPSLSASTQYHIVAKAFTDSGCTTEQSSFNQTNYTRWGLDQSGITYTDGLRSSYGTSWTSVADQAFAFEIYNNNFDITGNLTVGAWVKTSSWIEEKKVIAKWPSSGNDRGYILVAGSSGTASKPRFIVYIGGNSQAEASTSLANDTWHYLVGVYNGSSVKLYVNGVESASTNTSGSINNSSMPLTIGSDGAGGGIWNGTIDEPFVTAEALSADQIKHMYDVGYAALQSSGQGINKLNGSSNQVNAVAATGLSIRTDSVGAMHASPGILYAGSEGGGVSKIDLSSDTLVNAFSTGTPWVINHANVNALTPTTGGNFVAALDSGVSRLNDVSGRSDLSSTSYTHVSAVYDKITGYYYLYEGGKLVAKTNVGTSHSPVTDTNPFTIGAASVSTLVAPSIPLSIIQNQKSIFYFHFYGGIKNVSVHSSALDARTISYAANNSIDPVLHLSFDEGQGTVAHNAQWENVGTTTNLVTNPSFETDLTSWVTANGGTWTQDSTSSVQGNYSLKGVTTDNLQGKVFDLTGLTEGTVLSVSASLRAESGSARFYASDGDWSNAVISSLHTSSDWVRYTINKTVPSSGAIKIVLLGSTGGGTLYFDGVQLTQTSSATPYCDGSLLGNGSYSWNGTAHASTSTCTYGTDGTVHGATWQKDGAKNGSLSFDGTNDYVSVPNQESIDISGDITLSAWVKRDSGSREESIIGKYGNTPRDGYLLYITSADKASFTLATADTAYGVASTTSISSGNWFYVTGVKHGTTARVYVNGVLENSTTVGANLDTSTLSLLIGDTSSGVNNKFDGSIDEVKIYPYALTTTEIKNLFNAGGGSTALGTPSGQDDTTPALSFGASNEYCVPGSSDPCDAPVAEWKMDENQ